MRSVHLSAHTRTVASWAVLVAITLVSWLLGHSGVHRQTVVGVATITVLVLTVVKARVVLRSFMEVGAGPRWLRWGTDLWLLVLLVVIVGLYTW
ncbi:cytochrome C oxidase subunit IV family protein [Nocardia aobensis]|uniref:Cytochrome C oxidase subunit IV family protein n=1 Tax=Nocardia aobensis TaxID=257277 RepID=A0ABW6PA50_9NOCA